MKTHILASLVTVLLCSAAPLLAQNKLDPTFDPGSGANAHVESMIIQPDGKILICGLFTSFNGMQRNYLARLNADGSVDTSFNASPNYWVRTMALQPDNKIVIGGFFTSVDGLSRNRIARVNADGSVDTTFNPGTGCVGKIVPVDPTQPFLFALGLQQDGKIIIGGNFTNYNGTARSGVARLNTDGSLDTSFDVGAGANSWVRSILVLPNSQIMLGGWFQNYNNHPANRMVKLNPDGSMDTSFHPYFGDSTAVYGMALNADGKLVVCGHSANTNAPFLQEVVRLNYDGSFDPTFNPGGEGANEKVETILIQPNGKILIGGYFSQYNGVLRKGVARLNADGTPDAPIDANPNNWVWTLALQNDGRVMVCGAFSTLGGASRNGIGRLEGETAPEPEPVDPGTPEETDTGSLRQWLVNNTEFIESQTIASTPEIDGSWQLMAVGDVDGDHKSDFVLENTRGQVTSWLMDGTNFIKTNLLYQQSWPWRVAGVGDLNGDGNADLILRHTSERAAVAYFKKGKFIGASLFPKKLKVGNLRFVGMDDFNHDKHPDLLWQQEDNGQLVVWFMNKAKFLGSANLSDGQLPDAALRAAAIADLNGDRHQDILFENSAGQVSAWFMNGTNFLSSQQLFAEQQADPNWKLIGVSGTNAAGQNSFIWESRTK